METATTISRPQRYSSFEFQESSVYADLGISVTRPFPTVLIDTVGDAFRVATLTIELENSRNSEYMKSFLSLQATSDSVPEYFDNITTPDAGALYRFLIEHQDLFDIIVFSCDEAFKKFSHESKLSLEISFDESEKYLALMVRQKTYQKNIVKMIDEISEKFEDLLISRSGWFMITTDFNRPD